MHGVWANDRPGIYGACHVLPAGQHPPTEGCSRAAIWVERQPNGMDRCSLSYYSEVLSWAIPEVVLKRRKVLKGAPRPGVWGTCARDDAEGSGQLGLSRIANG